MRNHAKNSVALNFAELEKLDHNKTLFILVNDEMVLSNEAKKIDSMLNGLISSRLNNKVGFSGKLKEKCILTSKIGENINNIILVGIGKEVKSFELEEVGACINHVANHLMAKEISVLADYHFAEISNSEFASLLGAGIEEASYRFNKYQTETKEEDKPTLDKVNIHCQSPSEARNHFEFFHAINKGVFLTKDCVNESPNELYPESYSKLIIDEMKDYKNVSVKVLGEEEMQKLGMNALLGVGQGSHKESKLVVIQYNGTDSAKKPIALVGKGVTFDTGGISLKPSKDMHKMKYDMTGSACVVGTIKALAERGAKTNIVGVVALVENMPGGNAQRPGDVVKSMSGRTIEILDTDAEGRLILVDALTYVQKNFTPKLIIDLATLTGSIVVALGGSYAGCFANEENFAKSLIESGEKVNEKLWRMPLHKDYHSAMKSDCADIANISSVPGGGSCTAAAFIEKFIDKEMIWAHLDIAGVAWNNKGKRGAHHAGASGFGVKLLHKFIYDNHEDKA